MAERSYHFVDEPVNTAGIAKTPDYVNALSESPRYEDGFPEMIHRHSNYTHCRRVAAIADNLFFLVLPQGLIMNNRSFLNEQRVLGDFFGAHHDDDEIFRTDYPSDLKFKWTEEEKIENARLEAIAIEKVGREYLHLSGETLSRYIYYMEMYRKKEILAAQVVDVADKLDALGEVFHELRCGNKAFLKAYQYYRDEKLPDFNKYNFWEKIKSDPAIQIDSLPTDEEVLRMPTLSRDGLKSRETIREDIFDPTLPRWYRSWLGVNMNIFLPEPQPEFHMFPGWKTELRRRWNSQISELT